MNADLETGQRPGASVFESRAQRVLTGAGAAWRIAAALATADYGDGSDAVAAGAAPMLVPLRPNGTDGA